MFALFQSSPSWALYKYLVHILKNSSAVENCTGVRLGQVVNFLIFYNIWNSWLHTFHGFDFSFRWRDSENRQMGMHLNVKWDRKTRKVKSSHMLLRSLGQVNDLFSSTDLHCTCIHRRILAVQVLRSALHSRFTEQFFSSSRFTNTKYGRWRHHENKLAQPPSYP